MLKFSAFLIAAHVMSWLISCGPLLSKRIEDSRLLLCILGIPVTYLFMEATRHGYMAFGRLWTAKTVGFCVSTVVFTVMAYAFLGEAPTTKDIICLVLGGCIILVRIM